MPQSRSPQRDREPVQNVALRLQFLIPVFVLGPNSKFREGSRHGCKFLQPRRERMGCAAKALTHDPNEAAAH